MKKIIFPSVIALFVCLCSSCRMPQYVPVETVKTEYRDRILRDSIYRFDSVYIRDKGDTVFFERFRYRYRDKLIRDSIFLRDSIQVPFPVEVIKQVKKPLTGWQNFQVWCGRFALVLLLLIGVGFVLKRKFKL